MKIGYQWTFLFFALVGGILAFIPILGLMWKGAEWRQRLGKPGKCYISDTLQRGFTVLRGGSLVQGRIDVSSDGLLDYGQLPT
jgi:hypothetical protein